MIEISKPLPNFSINLIEFNSHHATHHEKSIKPIDHPKPQKPHFSLPKASQ
jgi:hypothetical protein